MPNTDDNIAKRQEELEALRRRNTGMPVGGLGPTEEQARKSAELAEALKRRVEMGTDAVARTQRGHSLGGAEFQPYEMGPLPEMVKRGGITKSPSGTLEMPVSRNPFRHDIRRPMLETQTFRPGTPEVSMAPDVIANEFEKFYERSRTGTPAEDPTKVTTDTGEEIPSFFTGPQAGADLSGKKVTSLDDALPGETVYLTKESYGLQPGNYTISMETVGAGDRGTGAITGEKRDKYYATDKAGAKTEYKTDNKKASDEWSLWNNPLNPLSWFN